jgi:hypothetical protein
MEDDPGGVRASFLIHEQHATAGLEACGHEKALLGGERGDKRRDLIRGGVSSQLIEEARIHDIGPRGELEPEPFGAR